MWIDAETSRAGSTAGSEDPSASASTAQSATVLAEYASMSSIRRISIPTPEKSRSSKRRPRAPSQAASAVSSLLRSWGLASAGSDTRTVARSAHRHRKRVRRPAAGR
jgi:hypothetical protein